MKIIVVDDDKAVISSIKLIINDLVLDLSDKHIADNVSVEEFHTPGDFIRCMNIVNNQTVIIMDYDLKDTMNGVNIIKTVFESNISPNIILFTGNSRNLSELERDFLDENSVEVIEKINTDQLEAKLNQFLTNGSVYVA